MSGVCGSMGHIIKGEHWPCVQRKPTSVLTTLSVCCEDGRLLGNNVPLVNIYINAATMKVCVSVPLTLMTWACIVTLTSTTICIGASMCQIICVGASMLYFAMGTVLLHQ